MAIKTVAKKKKSKSLTGRKGTNPRKVGGMWVSDEDVTSAQRRDLRKREDTLATPDFGKLKAMDQSVHADRGGTIRKKKKGGQSVSDADVMSSAIKAKTEKRIRSEEDADMARLNRGYLQRDKDETPEFGMLGSKTRPGGKGMTRLHRRAKGGSVKRKGYANGGSVRAARF